MYEQAIDIVLILILLTIIVSVFFIISSYFVVHLDNRMEELRRFIYKNDGIFRVIFILLFALEQIVLVFLIFIFSNNLDILRLIVSIFSLVVITTASFQEFVLQTKRKYEKEHYEVTKKAREDIVNLVNIIKRLKERVRRKKD